jgi:DNA polymerase-3 subunit delta
MAPKTAKTQKQNELVYVIAGDEATLVNAQYTQLIDKVISPQERDTGLLVVDADKAVISDVLDELRTLPFLTKKRVVVLRNADKFISARGQEEEQDEQDKQDGRGASAGPSNREILEKYFERPCPTGILVMTVSNWPKNTRLAKKLPEIGTLIEVKSPKGRELQSRLIGYAQEAHNKRLEYGAAELLVELAGDDITRLYTEVDKLATYAANEKSITIACVESLIGRNREFDAFEVIESCLQRRPGPAVERLRRMFADDKSAEYSTVGAFAYHFRRLFTAKKMLEEGHSQYEAAGKARIWYNKEAQFALLKRLTLRQIGDQIQQLAETDYAIKKGLAQPRVAIEQLVLRMATL